MSSTSISSRTITFVKTQDLFDYILNFLKQSEQIEKMIKEKNKRKGIFLTCSDSIILTLVSETVKFFQSGNDDFFDNIKMN